MAFIFHVKTYICCHEPVTFRLGNLFFQLGHTNLSYSTTCEHIWFPKIADTFEHFVTPLLPGDIPPFKQPRQNKHNFFDILVWKLGHWSEPSAKEFFYSFVKLKQYPDNCT